MGKIIGIDLGTTTLAYPLWRGGEAVVTLTQKAHVLPRLL